MLRLDKLRFLHVVFAFPILMLSCVKYSFTQCFFLGSTSPPHLYLVFGDSKVFLVSVLSQLEVEGFDRLKLLFDIPRLEGHQTARIRNSKYRFGFCLELYDMSI